MNRTRYFQGPKCGFTFGSGLAPFKKKNLGNHFLEEWLDLHFKGSTLHKTDWVTVLIPYSITVCLNILQYDTVFTISLPIDTAPPTPIKWVWNSFRIFFLSRFGIFFFDFLAGTICLVFATVWNLNLSFCMVFATFGHVHLPFCMGFTTCGHVHLPFCMVFAKFWHVHLPFCMGFPTCGHVHLPFCMVFATFWHVHLPFCMGCSTCEHVHPNIYRCGSLGLDKKRVGGIEGGR